MPLLASILLATVLQPTRGQSSLMKDLPPEAQAEIQYARGLIDLYLPDIAQVVIGGLERDFPEHPEIRNIVPVLQIEGFILRGDFDKAIAVIAQQPDQDGQGVWAMKLALADGYYAWGKFNEAQALYNSFFEAFQDPPAALKSFYVESAYKYAQMLILMGSKGQALQAYRRVLDAKPERHIQRQAQGEMAELMVTMADTLEGKKREAMLDRIEKLCTEILWYQDMWFGKAIVYLAHVRKMRGDVKGAQALIDEYTPQLKNIDDALKQEKEATGVDLTHLSPMAECRYLVGVIQQQEAERLIAAKREEDAFDLVVTAYKHFMNVFIRYPSTKWAPNAGVHAREVEDLLETVYNRRPRAGVTDEQMAKVVRYQFQSARALFNQQSFKKAIEAYTAVLNLFPEVEPSVAALSELARCYLETKEILYARMVVGHIAERFGGNRELKGPAGDRLIRLAEDVGTEFDMASLGEEIYQLYFSNIEDHARAPDLLYRFGRKALEAEDIDRARGYFERVRKEYPNALIFLPAISQVANCYALVGDRSNEVSVLSEYVVLLAKQNTPGHPYINGLYRLAVAYKELGGNDNLQQAIKHGTTVIELIEKGDPKYFTNQEDQDRNKQVLEGTIFLKAVCSTLLTEPEDKLDDFKRQAIEQLDALVKKFPKSEFAPVALSRIGVLYTVLGEVVSAEAALRKLAAEYPDSPEAKNAKYMLGKALLDLGKRKQAIDVFKEMFAGGGGEFSAVQILSAGQELAKAGEHEIALEAFDQVLKSKAGERPFEEPALMGKGRSMLALQKYEEAARALHELLTKYSNSGFTVDACYNASKANAELAGDEPDAVKRFDLFNEAVTYLKRAMTYEMRDGSDVPPGLARARANVQIARISVLKSRAEAKFDKTEQGEKTALKYLNEAIAGYQTVIMLTDPRVKGVGPMLQEAFHDCIPLMIETATADNNRAQQVIEDCDRFIEMYPSSKYVLDIRRWRSEAMIRKSQFEATGGGTQPETTAGNGDENKQP